MMEALLQIFGAAHIDEQRKRAISLVRDTRLSGYVQTSHFIEDLTEMLLSGLDDTDAGLYIDASANQESTEYVIHPAFH